MALTLNTGSVAVSTAPVQVVPANANRAELRLVAKGVNAPVFYGPDNTVSASTGYPITGLSNNTAEARLVETGAVWATSPGGPMVVYFLEITGP